MAWYGLAWLGMAWHGVACHGLTADGPSTSLAPLRLRLWHRHRHQQRLRHESRLRFAFAIRIRIQIRAWMRRPRHQQQQDLSRGWHKALSQQHKKIIFHENGWWLALPQSLLTLGSMLIVVAMAMLMPMLVLLLERDYFIWNGIAVDGDDDDDWVMGWWGDDYVHSLDSRVTRVKSNRTTLNLDVLAMLVYLLCCFEFLIGIRQCFGVWENQSTWLCNNNWLKSDESKTIKKNCQALKATVVIEWPTDTISIQSFLWNHSGIWRS